MTQTQDFMTAQEARGLMDQTPVTLAELGNAITKAARANLRIVGSGDFDHRPLLPHDRNVIADKGFTVVNVKGGWQVTW